MLLPSLFFFSNHRFLPQQQPRYRIYQHRQSRSARICNRLMRCKIQSLGDACSRNCSWAAKNTLHLRLSGGWTRLCMKNCLE